MCLFRRRRKTIPVIPEKRPTFKERWNQLTTSKKLVWFLIINAVVWIYCSYLLAWFGREQIAESLSSNVCTVIIGGILGYLGTSTLENVSKYNPKFGGSPKLHGTNYEEPLDIGEEPEPEEPVTPETEENQEEVLG